jgi:hypothetical protein
MPVTILPFNHTARKFLSGDAAEGSDFRINLYSAFTFDATATTKTEAETGATQLDSVNGYIQDNYQLQNVSVTTVGDNGAMFDADDPVWTADDGTITASYAMIYNNDDPDNAPLVFIDFGGTVTANDGGTLRIQFSINGIILIQVPNEEDLD